jgi:ankyrin repeat protein
MPDPKAKVARMIQPEPLRSKEYQPWWRGRGVDVWEIICSAITGDLEKIKTLVSADAGLVDCEFEYFKPLRFAVRENQRAVVDFLLQKGSDPAYEAGDSLVTIARDRGYTELAQLLESLLHQRYRIVPEAANLVAAIKARDLAKVRAMLEQHPELVDAADEHANQPIHWAVMTRQTELIDYLLERGADINAQLPNGTRPIHLTNGDYHYRGWRDLPATAMQRHEILIGYLLARGAYYDIATATKMGDLDRVRELLDQNSELVNRVTTHSYYTGLPLVNAARGGHIALVKFLLERGANPNEPEPGFAPFGGALMAAINGRHYEIAKLLLEHGANPNQEGESSGNCMSMMKFVGAPREMQDLLASYGGVMGADLADIETLAAMLHANPNLHVTEDFGNAQRMSLILRHQPEILKRTPDSNAWWNDATPTPEFARWLLEHGLDPNRKNWLGITMLHRCALKSNVQTAQVLLDFGADINVTETDSSSTPLGCAARVGNKEMVEWLLQKGADPRLPSDEPWALPVEWAKRRNRPEIVALLADR